MRSFQLRKAMAFLVAVISLATIVLPGTAGAEQVQRTLRPGITTPALRPQVQPQQAFPLVTAIAPPVLNQGQGYTLLISGRDLNRITAISFGPGIVVKSFAALNAAAAQAVVQVTTDAPPGVHAVTVTAGNVTQQARPTVQVMAAQSPDIISASPQVLVQGQPYTLTLTIRNYTPRLSLAFGEGIQPSGPVSRVGDMLFQMPVQVSSAAALGRHDITILYGEAKKKATAFVMVNAAPAAGQRTQPEQPLSPSAAGIAPAPARVSPRQPLATAPSITIVTPNQWLPGKSYQLTVIGERFSEGMECNFGEDVAVKGAVTVKTASLAQVEVAVSPSAKAGERKARLRNSARQQWTAMGAVAWVMSLSPASVAPAVVMPQPDLEHVVLGSIKLKQPEDYLTGPGFTFPVNDDMVFTWEETNPGLAEWFELHIVTEAGRVLMKRRLEPVTYTINGVSFKTPPAYYRPDQAFLDEMLTNTFYLTGSPESGGTYAEGLSGLLLQWEVAGFRTYTKTVMTELPSENKGKPGKKIKTTEQKDVQVEISDRRSIAVPDKPTGLACQGSLKRGTNNSIEIVNTDAGKNTAPGAGEVASYPHDRWQVSGDFTLDKSPYASHYDPVVQTSSGGYFPYQFSNIFIDWGDGAIDELSLESQQGYPPSHNHIFRIRTPLPEHAYSSTGRKVIRIFQLPEGDIQQTDPGLVVSAFDSSSQGQGSSPYYQALNASGVAWQVRPSGPSLSELASRAYMIYCSEVLISPRKDLVAGGLLHLESLEITGYNGMGDKPMPTLSPHAQAAAMNMQLKPDLKPAEGQKAIQKKLVKSRKVMKASDSIKAPQDAGAVSVSEGLMESIGPTDVDALLSACDIFQANALLTYYGKGRASVQWRLLDREGGNDMVVGTELLDPLGPSPQRDMAQLSPEEAAKPSFPGSLGYKRLDSDLITPDNYVLGRKYHLRVTAQVGLAEAMALDQEGMMNLLSGLLQSLSGSFQNGKSEAMAEAASACDFEPEAWRWQQGRLYAAADATQPVRLAAAGSALQSSASANPYLSAISQSGVKLGVLSPSKKGNGLPAVASINQAFEKATAKQVAVPDIPKKKPYYVSSPLFSFKVVENAPDKPCKLLFPTKSGDIFEVRNLSRLKQDGEGRYNGEGRMVIPLYRGEGTVYEKVVQVKIKGWQLEPDGITVAEGGVIDEPLGDSLDAAGMSVTMERLAARAQETDMDLTLTLRPQDRTILLPGTTTQPAWVKKTAPLSTQGDWFYQDSTPLDIAIGWSGYTLHVASAALDLSSRQQHPVGSAVQGDGCGGEGGAEWAGIHFGGSVLRPYLANLASQTFDKAVTNWGIIKTGICGNADFGGLNAVIQGGSIGFDSIHADASAGNFKAVYKNMQATVPWPGITVQGDAELVEEPGTTAQIRFDSLKAGKVTKLHTAPGQRRISLAAEDFLFGNYPGTGWGIKGLATFGIEFAGVPFSTGLVVKDMIFGMDGLGYLADGGSSVALPAGGAVRIDGAQADLSGGSISGFGTEKLSFDFAVKARISKTPYIEAATTTVGFSLTRQGSGYASPYKPAGPDMQPFSTNLAFRDITGKINLSFIPSSGATADNGSMPLFASLGAGLNGVAADTAPAFPGILLASNGGTPVDRFSGTVDLGMFGQDNLAGNVTFRLGYMGDEDYWILLTDTGDLPGDGVVVIPGIVHLKRIRGGLGHNFPDSAYTNPSSILTVVPETNGETKFLAGGRFIDGVAAGHIYTLDVDMLIKSSGIIDNQFRGWLLSTNPGEGSAPFYGHVQYGAGGFSGSIAGKYSWMDNYVYIEAPENAIQFWMNNGGYYIGLGSKDGARVKGHVFIIDADAYLELGSQVGLRAGASSSWHPDPIGDCDALCLKLSYDLAAEAAVTANPLHFAGGLSGNVKGQICAVPDLVGCGGVNVGLSGNFGFLPPEFVFSFSASIPCVDVNVKAPLLPPADWSIGYDSCIPLVGEAIKGALEAAGYIVDTVETIVCLGGLLC